MAAPSQTAGATAHLWDWAEQAGPRASPHPVHRDPPSSELLLPLGQSSLETRGLCAPFTLDLWQASRSFVT